MTARHSKQGRYVRYCFRCGRWYTLEGDYTWECPKCKEPSKRVKCSRCGYEWTCSKDIPPFTCSKCKTPYWNRERMIS